MYIYIYYIAHILYVKQEYLLVAASPGGSKCSNRINDANFLTVFYSNYRSSLLSF